MNNLGSPFSLEYPTQSFAYIVLHRATNHLPLFLDYIHASVWKGYSETRLLTNPFKPCPTFHNADILTQDGTDYTVICLLLDSFITIYCCYKLEQGSLLRHAIQFKVSQNCIRFLVILFERSYQTLVHGKLIRRQCETKTKKTVVWLWWQQVMFVFCSKSIPFDLIFGSGVISGLKN